MTVYPDYNGGRVMQFHHVHVYVCPSAACYVCSIHGDRAGQVAAAHRGRTNSKLHAAHSKSKDLISGKLKKAQHKITTYFLKL